MVTKYDIFEFMYQNGSVLKPQEIVQAFKKSDSEYHTIYKILLELKKNKWVAKTDHGFLIVRSTKTDQLYKIIKFCISNKINYNELLEPKFASFIYRAMSKNRFSINDFNLNPRTFSKYIEILSKYGLLLIISRKPLSAFIPYNSFLRDLALFYGSAISVSKPNYDDYSPEIESELKRFRSLIKKNNRRYVEIMNEYEIKFIQHSLNLEGNPITLPDTIKLLKEQIIPKELSVENVLEVQNYQKAVNQMIKDSFEKKLLTKESMLNYHYLAMQHRPEIAGQIRKVNVFIKGNPDFKIASPSEINMKLDSLLNKYEQFSTKKTTVKELLKFSAYFHNEFQHIHPFIDGNSRTTRLITFHLFCMKGFPMLDIPLGLLENYLFSTKGSRKREDKVLKSVLQSILLYNLRTVNEKIK